MPKVSQVLVGVMVGLLLLSAYRSPTATAEVGGFVPESPTKATSEVTASGIPTVADPAIQTRPVG